MTAILLDTDIGSDIDDAVALAYLLAHPDAELVGITTVSGDTEQRAACATAICNAADLRVSKDNFRITKGKTKLTRYVFNTGVAKHFFCSVCGIKSFYVPRSHPDGYSINFRCLDDPKAFHSVVTTEFDGREWEKNAGDLAPLEAR